MSTPKVVAWEDVRDMLDNCAPGWKMADKLHHRYISWNGRSSTVVPLGPHDKRSSQNYDVPAGKVRNLIWTLGLSVKCAASFLNIPITERP